MVAWGWSLALDAGCAAGALVPVALRTPWALLALPAGWSPTGWTDGD